MLKYQFTSIDAKRHFLSATGRCVYLLFKGNSDATPNFRSRGSFA